MAFGWFISSECDVTAHLVCIFSSPSNLFRCLVNVVRTVSRRFTLNPSHQNAAAAVHGARRITNLVIRTRGRRMEKPAVRQGSETEVIDMPRINHSRYFHIISTA